MSNKALLAGTAVLVIAGGGAGAWYAIHHGGDPMAIARQAMSRGDVRTAGIELRNAVREHPGNAEAHFRLAEVQLVTGDVVAAEREARQAIKTGYAKAAADRVLSEAMLREGKYKEVLAQFKTDGLPPAQAATLLTTRALAQLGIHDAAAAQTSIAEAEKLAPHDPKITLVAARVAAFQHDYTTAQKDVDRTLKLDPKNLGALVLKGQLANANGDRKAAEAAFTDAIAVAPTSAAARLERANLLMTGNHDAKARADVDVVLKADPSNAPALYLRAVLAIRAKDFKTADQDLQKISTVLAQIPRGYYFLAMDKAGLGQIQQAGDAIERYVARNPRDLDGLKLLAQIELNARQPDNVIRALAPAATSGIADAQTLDLLGRAYAMKGETPQAATTLEHASALAPGDAAILTHLASTRMQLGDASGAVSTFERSLKVQPSQTGAEQALVIAAVQSGNLDQAQAALDKLRARVGDTEAVGNLTGLIRLAHLDLAGAEKQFRAVIMKYPKSVAARLNLARVLSLENKPGDAEQVLQDALNLEPANQPALAAYVALALQTNHPHKALAAVQAAHKAAPAADAITAALSDLYVRVGESKKALSLLDATASGGSLPPDLLLARAHAAYVGGDIAGAERAWRDLLNVQPGNIGARRLLVSALVHTKDFKAAQDVVRQGLTQSPGNPILLATATAIAGQQGGLKAALAEADRLRQDPANMPAAAFLKGDLLMTAHRYGDAAAAYEAEYKLAPSSALALRAATAQEAAGAPHAAVQQLQAWLKRTPDDADALRMLASMEVGAGQYSEAEPKLREVLKQRPNDPVALNNLAWALQEQGNPEALGFARRAFLAAPSPDVADTLGWILASRGQAADALPLLEQAVKGKPNDPSVQYHLALALAGAGQKPKAEQILDKVVQSPVAFADKPKAQALLDQLKAQR